MKSLNNEFCNPPGSHEAILPPNSSKIPSSRDQANILINHYASISRLPHSPLDRRIRNRLKAIKINRNTDPVFTPEMVTDAIQKSGNSKARGPDDISYNFLKHIGPIALKALTDIFNWSVRCNVIPAIWKLASILPILKPGKSPTTASSYRPISLLCNSAKVLERLVLSRITPYIPLSPSQHGFRPRHSTSTLLSSLSQSVLENLNARKPAPRTLLGAVDVSKAFDTVPRFVLISKILSTDLPSMYKKWLSNFVSGRQAITTYNGLKSRTRQFPNGVPQGAVLSPTLFNLFLHDLPTPQCGSVFVSSYADDVTIVSQHHLVQSAAEQMQQYIHQLEGWLTANRMKVSPAKSSLTLITPYNREYNSNPTVNIFNSPIPVTHTSKILGVTFDRGSTFGHHVSEIN